MTDLGERIRELRPVCDLRPLLHLHNGRLVFETKMTANPLYPFQCTICRRVEWHNAVRAAELGLVLTVEGIT